MEEKRLRKLKIRKGNNNQRKVTLFEEGEPVFVKDTERVFIGDDTTVGGIRISNKNFILNNSDKPPESEINDIFVNEIDKSAFLVENESSVIEIFPSLVSTCINVKKDIDDIDNLLKLLSSVCCNPAHFLATDLDNFPVFSDNILIDNTDTIRIKDIEYIK